MTDYSLATINSSNSLASRLVRAVGGGRLQDIVSGTPLSTVGTVGDTADGYTFSGASAIGLPDTPLTQFTVFALAYAYSGEHGTLVSRSAWGDEAYNQNYVLRLQGGLTPRGQFKEDGTSNFPTLNSGSSGSAGTLLTTAFSFDGTNQELYLNGVSVGTQAASAPWTSTSTAMVTQIGAVDGTERAAPYGGLGIQLVLIFNAALSDAEIASLHSNPNQVFNLGGAPADTTAPTLTSATATATSVTTATGGVTTDEAGPAWAVLTTSSTTPSAAQIKAGQDHTGAAASASATATLAVGANSGVFSFTGLTGGGTYWLHVVQDDTATPANTATPITSASSITTPTPDTTPPTMNGSITVGTKTSGSISISYPAASDNVAVTGYEVSTNGSTWSDNSTSLSYTFLGLSALTSYTLYVRAYDAAGNRAATPLTATTSTYRAGASAGSIRATTGPQDGNPKGTLYDFCELLPADTWVSYYTVSGPTPPGGTLDPQPNGAFSYFGPDAAIWVIQPEANGVAAAEPITITLYDQTVDVDDEPPVLTGTITVSGLTSTGYTMSWPTGSDDTGISAYEYSLNGGTSWTSQAGASVSVTGRTPGATDQVRVRAKDAAGNVSSPPLSAAVTLLAAPDVIAPILTGPAAVVTGSSTAVLTVNTNEAGGELSYLVKTSPTFTEAELEAAPRKTVLASGLQTINLSGLAPLTTYYVFLCHVDEAGNGSVVVSPDAFATLAPPEPGTVKRWNGSAWSEAGTLKRWNGSAWVAAPLKRFTGAVWE